MMETDMRWQMNARRSCCPVVLVHAPLPCANVHESACHSVPAVAIMEVCVRSSMSRRSSAATDAQVNNSGGSSMLAGGRGIAQTLLAEQKRTPVMRSVSIGSGPRAGS